MSRPNALIVEDNNDLSIIYRNALLSGGYSVEICQNGGQAFDYLERLLPTLVILDLHLPEVNGTDILKQMKLDERYEKTRVIIASADANLARTLEDTADIVLMKPVSFRQLREIAQRFAARPN